MDKNIELFTSEDEEQSSTVKNGLFALVVDDSKSMRSVISQILTAAGFNVFEACDGMEAMQYFLKHNIDIVVTDLHMPKMNGHQLLQQIIQIANSNNQQTRVIVSSSDSKKTTIINILKISRSSKISVPLSFLVKPWKTMDLLIQIRNLFPKNLPLEALDEQVELLNNEMQVDFEEKRLIIGISETKDGIKIELGCDQQLSLESDTISEYLDSLENAVFTAPVANYICCLSNLVHQSPQSMVTLLLLIKGIADKYEKNIQFVEATPSVRDEVKRQGLMDILLL